MGRIILVIIFFSAVLLGAGSRAYCQNPFMSPKKATEQVSQAPGPKSTFLLKISLWQQQLKRKMAALVRQAKTEKRSGPLVIVLLLSLGYGALHAAGPGHGKAIATSFMLSRNPTIFSGLAFGILTALFHGMSGILCVLLLRYILEQSVSSSLESASSILQTVSFTLIGLLGMGILINNLYALIKVNDSVDGDTVPAEKTTQKNFLLWALAVGLVPCPGVVMVLLFCMSMDAFMLGLLLAICISIGMAMTISFVILAVVIGKAYSMSLFSDKWTIRIERFMGLFSGLAVTTLAILFLIA
ncbi:MAG: hypothetical protein GY846_03415 [Deltaproteobacteria bacterium]|nr:hypothetical protein [Deltaproteobacteria bacterium]